MNWVNWWRDELVFVSEVFEANHFWSLAAEEQFYLVWPALVVFLPRRAFLGVSIALDPWMARVGCTLAVLGCAAAVLEAARSTDQSLAGRLLRGRALSFLGRYSYGLYVIHWAFHPLFDRFFFAIAPREPTGIAVIDGLYVTLVKSAVALAAAVLVHHAFEQRFLAWKDRFAPAKPAPTPAKLVSPG